MRIKALMKFFFWQFYSRFIVSKKVVDFGERSKLMVRRGKTGSTGNFYCGLHDFQEMLFLLHFLREDDLFLDVGANIGSYSILAAGERFARTISIEASPEVYTGLMENIRLNGLENRIQTYNVAAGRSEGKISFTDHLDTLNHIVSRNAGGSIEVDCVPLDNLMNKIPLMAKIDVEGFEPEVIWGMENTLKNKGLKAIIIELNGSGKNYGFSDNDTHKVLIGHGFVPCSYDPMSRCLNRLDNYTDGNTIYIRDIDYVKTRLVSAESFHINKLAI